VRPHEALGVQTPASVYEPSERAYPAKVREPEYPSTMLVRSVHSHGHFRWKKRHDVFLNEVLWGERVGLLPIDERWYTVYFAELPLARFDSWQRQVQPLPPEKNPKGAKVVEPAGSYMAEAGEEEVSLPLHPIPSPGCKKRKKCQACAQSKMSDMSPAVQHRRGGGGARVLESGGTDSGALCEGSIRSRRGWTDVQDGGLGKMAGGGNDRISGAQRRSGQGAGVPD